MLFIPRLRLSQNYTAAIKATESIYGVKPDLTREGGSIPVYVTFARSSQLPHPPYADRARPNNVTLSF